MNIFHASATGFDKENALFLAKLSALAYEEEAIIRATLLAEYQISEFAFLESHQGGFDTELFIAANNEAVFVVFRGTETAATEDWLSNIDTSTVPMFFGNIHRGFWQALQAVGDEMENRINAFQNQNQALWFAGHSQGGALAMLAARTMKEAPKEIQGVYTFGQPKVGDMLFSGNYAVALSNKTFRLCNEGDTIVDTPPNYYHCGIQVNLGREGQIEIKEDLNMLETGGGFASVLDSLFDFASGDIEDHSMNEYIRRLEI